MLPSSIAVKTSNPFTENRIHFPYTAALFQSPLNISVTRLIFLEHRYLLYCPKRPNLQIKYGCVCVYGERGMKGTKAKSKKENKIG